MTSEEKKRVQYKRLIVDIKDDLDSVRKIAGYIKEITRVLENEKGPVRGSDLMACAGYLHQMAIEYARGETYRGKTSPYWYTSENFFELFQSFSGSVRELIVQSSLHFQSYWDVMSYLRIKSLSVSLKEPIGLSPHR
ncbi:hypothetical protein [Desulfosporosinus sp. BICA1-9]|uniref:hypothetical protein n=1 Tax=Desulfosporosinus sp. BICA1-9 TaxID=1531958 RepID=UPI00054C3762|nr:hypothetical protein [Desulfosporosinus sp. BICA1-9]KJS46134.1 MAG: hypothetical protein VR66_27160 [Peptococcaceae bacterium BRH_c23]KJS83725.1 MAG: hypothetical protein JL57_22325 [Desulfosporosinus sp. BICA1-9]